MKFTLMCGAIVTTLNSVCDAIKTDSPLPHWFYWTLAIIWVLITLDAGFNYIVVRK